DGMLISTVSDAAAVREELSLRERAMDAAPVGIVITDPGLDDNAIVHANDEFVDLTGYAREEILGRNCRFLQGPATREEAVGKMRRAIEDAEPVTVELRNYRKNGEVFWNRVRIAPLRNDDGDVTNYVGFQEDVTEYRERTDPGS
ncbi:hybrid sensor histidine kinase/response regulator, partial [Halobacteriales archaeon SW_12_67_38]